MLEETESFVNRLRTMPVSVVVFFLTAEVSTFESLVDWLLLDELEELVDGVELLHVALTLSVSSFDVLLACHFSFPSLRTFLLDYIISHLWNM